MKPVIQFSLANLELRKQRRVLKFSDIICKLLCTKLAHSFSMTRDHSHNLIEKKKHKSQNQS